jgi:dTMP kinase
MPLIVLEGIDGCGKSTQAERLERRLRAAGRTVRRLREPGGTALGEAVRALILDPATRACPAAELFAYQLARAQLCDEVLRPALGRGEVVVLDRFWHSTLAYQAYGLGLDPAPVRAVVELAIGGLKADAALWFDLDPEAALRRRAAARGEDRIEARGLEYQRRVHHGYAALCAAGELARIDAAGDADAVEALVRAALAGVLA